MAEDTTTGADEREAMSGDEALGRVYDERAEAHYKLSEEIRRAPGRFTKDFIIAEMCGAVGELSYEVQRLRATIEKTGATASRRVEAAREREDIWRDRLLPQLAAATVRAETAEAALETLHGQLLAEREAWREGSAARLEQQTGKKVTIVLAPKDQCTATIDIWGVRCEKIGGHPELHYARTGGGHVEWRGLDDARQDDQRQPWEPIRDQQDIAALVAAPTDRLSDEEYDAWRSAWMRADAEQDDARQDGAGHGGEEAGTQQGAKRSARTMTLVAVFLRVTGFTHAETGRLLGVSGNAVAAWERGARMNQAHRDRLEDLNGRAQLVLSKTFYGRREAIFAPRDGKPCIYDEWLAEGWTLPIDADGESAYFEAGEPEYRFVQPDGSVSEFDVHNGPCDCQRQMRVGDGPWLAAGGWVGADAAPLEPRPAAFTLPPREALERLAAEQGVRPVVHIDDLSAAPEDRLPEADMAAFLASIRSLRGGHDIPNSTPDNPTTEDSAP